MRVFVDAVALTLSLRCTQQDRAVPSPGYHKRVETQNKHMRRDRREPGRLSIFRRDNATNMLVNSRTNTAACISRTIDLIIHLAVYFDGTALQICLLTLIRKPALVDAVPLTLSLIWQYISTRQRYKYVFLTLIRTRALADAVPLALSLICQIVACGMSRIIRHFVTELMQLP